VPDLSASFAKPFDLQIAALRLRLANQVGTAAWDDLIKSQHDRAFVVAGAMKADLLADLGKAVEKAIGEHRSIEQFRADFRQIVTDRGWHGWTGEGTAKGEAWRAKVIYRTNMRTSYAAGRMAQLAKGKFKFWVYRHGGSLEPRLQHLAWDGVALPPDHPFWATHAPPNGWGCTCEVFGTNSAAGIRRVGGDPDKQLPPGWDATDAKTGEPVGIDKGWGYAPGASVLEKLQAFVAQKAEVAPSPVAADLLESFVESRSFADWFAEPKGDFPLVRIDEEQAALIGAKTTVGLLSPKTAAKQLKEHPELLVSEYVMAQGVITNATTVVRDSATDLVFVQEGAPEPGYVLVVKATLSGNRLYVTSFRRLSRLKAESDRQIRRLLRRSVE
jgi:hypothetical protein